MWFYVINQGLNIDFFTYYHFNNNLKEFLLELIPIVIDFPKIQTIIKGIKNESDIIHKHIFHY